MPIKVIRPDHFELLGEGHVLLVSPHQHDSETEFQTGQIVEDAALTCRAYAIMGKVDKAYLDPTKAQAAKTQLRSSIEAMLGDSGIQCIIEIRIKEEIGVDIWAGKNGETTSPSILEVVKSRLSKDHSPRVNQAEFDSSDSIINGFAKKGTNGQLLVQTFKLEFGKPETSDERDKLATTIAELIVLVNQKLGFKEDSR